MFVKAWSKLWTGLLAEAEGLEGRRLTAEGIEGQQRKAEGPQLKADWRDLSPLAFFCWDSGQDIAL